MLTALATLVHAYATQPGASEEVKADTIGQLCFVSEAIAESMGLRKEG